MMWSMYLLSFQTFVGEIQILKQKHSMLGVVIGVKVNTVFFRKNQYTCTNIAIRWYACLKRSIFEVLRMYSNYRARKISQDASLVSKILSNLISILIFLIHKEFNTLILEA